MTAEEIMHALRQAAMGRVNTPEQQRLCEALEKLMNPEQGFVGVLMTAEGERVITAPKDVAEAINLVAEHGAKRTRKTKAD